MTCNDEYILFVVLLAAFSLVKAMEERHKGIGVCANVV